VIFCRECGRLELSVLYCKQINPKATKMENIDEPQPPQQVPVLPDSKKWYQHKGVIAIVILLLITILVTGSNSLRHSFEPTPIVKNTAASIPASTASTPSSTPAVITKIYTQNIRGPYIVPPVQPTTNTSQSSGSYTSTKHVTASGSDSVAKVAISTDVTTTVNCGSADCFDQHFSNCTPATMTANAGGIGSVSDKIIGPATGGCSVTFMYTKSPDPAWVKQPMTCTFDNTKDFQTSFDNTFSAVVQGQKTNCTGPLVAILTPAASSATVIPTPISPNNTPNNAASPASSPPSGVGTTTIYLSANEDSTINGLEFKVNSITSSQLNITITDTSSGQNQSVSLIPNSPVTVLGHDIMVTAIQQVSEGTVNGQPIYSEQATLNYK
jgi:hypothetical protein